jgi:Tn3 transposase DDE domain
MRLKVLIEAGVVLPAVILRKLAAAGPSNALSRALRVLGRIERTLFTLQWLSDPAFRRAVFFHWQGEIRDRTFENQSFRASSLSLITPAIVHWNTVYLDRAVRQLPAQADLVPDDLLAHVAPLGWEHIALTGDYVRSGLAPRAEFRALRDVYAAFLPQAAYRAVLNKSSGDPILGAFGSWDYADNGQHDSTGLDGGRCTSALGPSHGPQRDCSRIWIRPSPYSRNGPKK